MDAGEVNNSELLAARPDVELTTRRGFLLDAGRLVVLAGLTGAAAVLVGRGWEDCFGHRECSICKIFDGCELPYRDPNAQQPQPTPASKEG